MLARTAVFLAALATSVAVIVVVIVIVAVFASRRRHHVQTRLVLQAAEQLWAVRTKEYKLNF